MSGTDASPRTTAAASWLPLIVVVLTQVQASFAVNALTVSMGWAERNAVVPITTAGWSSTIPIRVIRLPCGSTLACYSVPPPAVGAHCR